MSDYDFGEIEGVLVMLRGIASEAKAARAPVTLDACNLRAVLDHVASLDKMGWALSAEAEGRRIQNETDEYQLKLLRAKVASLEAENAKLKAELEQNMPDAVEDALRQATEKLGW